MQPAGASVVLFARDHATVAEFYTRALGMTLEADAADHSLLTGQGFELTIHRVSPHLAAQRRIEDPPVRRTGAP